jgi:jouberin
VTSDDALEPEVRQKKKKKRKPKKKEEEEPMAEAYAAATAMAEAEESHGPRIIEDHGKIAGITVHRTDKLKTDFFMAHPVVRISLIDINTGQYVAKQTK